MIEETLNLKPIEKFIFSMDISAREAKKDYDYFERQDRNVEKYLIEGIIKDSGLYFNNR